MTDDQLLDLLGMDFLHATVDDVLDPPLDRVEDAFRSPVPAGEVAGAVEAVRGEGRAVVRRGAVVAADRIRAARGQLTDIAVRDLPLATGFEDPDLVARRYRRAYRLVTNVLAGARRGHREHPLGHAEHLPDP